MTTLGADVLTDLAIALFYCRKGD